MHGRTPQPIPYSAQMPHRITITVDVPQSLDRKQVNEQVNLLSSRLRFVLGAHYRAQMHTRAVARVAANDARARLARQAERESA